MPELTIRYNAPRTMGALLRSSAYVRGVVGPVGSGKSSGCIVEILRRATEQRASPDGIRRSRWAVIRNTYPELRDTTRKTFEQWVPDSLGTWHEQSFTFTMRFGDVEAEIIFRALDKPQDIKKLLSLELTGAYINEAREVPKQVFDVLQTRVGRFPSKAQGGPTWFGIWFDTNPWHYGHWLGKLFADPPEDFECYWQPDGMAANAENVENLPAGYYDRLCAGKDQSWIDVYVRGKEAKSDVGSIYGELLAQVAERGDIGDFKHETSLIRTHWDLGHDDSTDIWLWRVGPRGVEVVDHYENHGKPMSHYFNLLESWTAERGYIYAKHYLPHDARAKTLATGTSILDLCIETWGSAKIELVPKLSLQDGITAGRWLMERIGMDAKDDRLRGPRLRIHSRCSRVNADGDTDGLESLRAYRRKWDEDKKTFSEEPVHDFASHAADAYRYMAVTVRDVFESSLREANKAAKKPAAVPVNMSVTLDQLWETRSRGQRRVG